MFTKDDIIAKLESGTPVEAIADEMAQALNEAQAEYTKSKEAERLADEAVKKLYSDKRAAMEVILDGFSDYLYVTGEDILLDELAECNIDELIEGFDAMLELAKGLKSIMPVVKGINEDAASPATGTLDELMWTLV